MCTPAATGSTRRSGTAPWLCASARPGRNAAPRTSCFFLQAEDGIRDIGVTGVQTCALPISATLVNVHESTMAREAGRLWPTHAGPEIGVASTKAFTAQVSAMTALAVAAAAARGRIDAAEHRRLVRALLEVPRLISTALEAEDDVRAVAHDLAKARDVLYLGRGSMYALALEGAL